MLPSAGKALAVVLATNANLQNPNDKVATNYEAGLEKVLPIDCRYLTAQDARTTWPD
jgi:hypothetical protein